MHHNLEIALLYLSAAQVFIFPLLAWIALTLWDLSHKVKEIDTRLKYGLTGNGKEDKNGRKT